MPAGARPAPVPAQPSVQTSRAYSQSYPNTKTGMLAPGNIGLHNRPVVHNPDGSISTVRSISITGDGGRAYLLPTAVGGRVVSNDDAIRHYQQTGENLGTFSNEDYANAYAQQLHEAQAQQYDPVAAYIAQRRSARTPGYY